MQSLKLRNASEAHTVTSTIEYKKLSCRRETARCFLSLNISLSLKDKVIQTDTFEKGVSPY